MVGGRAQSRLAAPSPAAGPRMKLAPRSFEVLATCKAPTTFRPMSKPSEFSRGPGAAIRRHAAKADLAPSL